MAETRRHRTAVVVGILLASLLLFGCDFFDGFSETAGQSPRGFEPAYPLPDEAESEQSQDAAPSDEEAGALTGAQDSPDAEPFTAQDIPGTYSASAALSRTVADVEAEKSLPVTVQLNADGTGTATVNGYSGTAQFSGSRVTFSVTMKEGGQSVVCNYTGTLAGGEEPGQMAITGTMNCSLMGVTFAYYEWTGYK